MDRRLKDHSVSGLCSFEIGAGLASLGLGLPVLQKGKQIQSFSLIELFAVYFFGVDNC